MSSEQAAVPVPTAGPSSTNNSPAAALDLNPTGFVDDLYNVVHSNCAAGFDALEGAIRSDLAPDLTPEQMVAALQGTANLYQNLRTELNQRLQTFEQYALAESLKVPAGLMAPAAPDADGGGEVDEGAEAAAEAALVDLRRQIAVAKQQGREMQAEEAELRRMIDDLGGKVRQLEAVPAALAGRDNLMDDIRAIADGGVALEAGCAKLDTLRGGDAPSTSAAAFPIGGGDDGLSDEAAEKELLRRQQAVRAAAPEDLRKLRETLGIQ